MLILSHVLKKLSAKDLLFCLYYARWLYVRKILLKKPVAFSFRAAFFLFSILLFMPFHPMSIPISIGAGLSISLLARGLAR
jgi:hypothetical protein